MFQPKRMKNRIATGLVALMAVGGVFAGTAAVADTPAQPAPASTAGEEYYLVPFQYVEHQNQGSLYPVGNPIPYDPNTTMILNTKPTEETMESSVPTWVLAAMGFAFILVLMISAALTQRDVRSWKK